MHPTCQIAWGWATRGAVQFAAQPRNFSEPPEYPLCLDTYLVVVCRQDLEASSPYVVSDSGGEEPKRKNKPPPDVYEPNVKGKKRVSIIFFTGPAPAADFTTSL